MAKIKSPGQKRKSVVRIAAIVVFLVASYIGSLVNAKFKNLETAWVADHQQVQANVTELNHETEEYRTVKGRLREREVYYVSYEFSAGGEQYGNTMQIAHSVYETLAVGKPISVWYASDNPGLNDSEQNIESTISSNNLIENMIGVAPFTAPGTLVLYWLLSMIFVRESKKALPEGFYTENSWLDIDDDYVVWLDDDDLVYFNFDAKRADAVQEAYQKGAGLEELSNISKARKFKRVPLSAIDGLSSAHNSDVIDIKVGDESHSVEFLNQTVKAHALERIKALIPGNLQHSRIEKTRLQAALPWIITLAVMIGGLFYFEMFLVQLALGLLSLIWAAPRVVSRLLDPAVIDRWKEPEVLAENTSAA